MSKDTKRLSNKEWIDFLVLHFDISRTSARDMLHVMMRVKYEDNCKKRKREFWVNRKH